MSLPNRWSYVLYSTVLLIFFIIFTFFVKINVPLFIFRIFQSRSDTQSNTPPFPSNQWHSALFTDMPSTIYPYPLSYRIGECGLGISYPQINAVDKTVFGSYVEDICIGFSDMLLNNTVQKVHDLSVMTTIQSKQGNANITIGRGLPFSVMDSIHGNGVVHLTRMTSIFPDELNKRDAKSKTDTVSIDTQNGRYVLLMQKSHVVKRNETSIEIDSPGKIVVVFVSDKNLADSYEYLKDVEITGSTVSYHIQKQNVMITYQWITNMDIPFGILPHNTYDGPTSIASYTTLRGILSVYKTKSIQTSVPKQTVETTFAPLSNPSDVFLQTLRKDILSMQEEATPSSTNYGFSTWIGRGTTLVELGFAHKINQEASALKSRLKDELFKNLSYYRYDRTLKSMISTNPEYGNEKLNDHHFHYGYIIRAASVLSQDDEEYYKKISPLVNELVLDILETDRTSERYPYMRAFDQYEHHSWADGYGDTPDGNNQESTSEAVNAWYGIMIWARRTGNDKLLAISESLYSLEVRSAQQYWFDIDGYYSSLGYKHALASIVFGGKVDFATWFSGETNMIYGIQLLPITPGSNYVSQISGFERYQADYLSSGGSYNKPWGALFSLFRTMQTKQISVLDAQSLEAQMPMSLVLYIQERYK